MGNAKINRAGISIQRLKKKSYCFLKTVLYLERNASNGLNYCSLLPLTIYLREWGPDKLITVLEVKQRSMKIDFDGKTEDPFVLFFMLRISNIISDENQNIPKTKLPL